MQKMFSISCAIVISNLSAFFLRFSNSGFLGGKKVPPQFYIYFSKKSDELKETKHSFQSWFESARNTVKTTYQLLREALRSKVREQSCCETFQRNFVQCICKI